MFDHRTRRVAWGACGQIAWTSSVNAAATRCTGGDVGGKFAVSASQVLNEGVAGDDRLAGTVGMEPAHPSGPVLELAVISLDRIVGMPFDVVPRRRDQVVGRAGVDRGGVGDHLGRRDLQRGRARQKTAGPQLWGSQKRLVCPELVLYAVRSYSLISPPTTSRRLTRSWARSTDGGSVGTWRLQLQCSMWSSLVVVAGVLVECSAEVLFADDHHAVMEEVAGEDGRCLRAEEPAPGGAVLAHRRWRYAGVSNRRWRFLSRVLTGVELCRCQWRPAETRPSKVMSKAFRAAFQRLDQRARPLPVGSRLTTVR